MGQFLFFSLFIIALLAGIFSYFSTAPKQPSFVKNVYGNKFINYTGTRDMDDIVNLIQFSDFFIGVRE